MNSSTAETHDPVRISKIAGRFLIFDHEAASTLRRRDNINGTLVGTAPQQPTQNIFLGLPIEIRPEEAEALVKRNAAYVVDSAVAHQTALRSKDPAARKAYVDMLRDKRETARKVFAEQKARSALEIAEKVAKQKAKTNPKRDSRQAAAKHDPSQGDDDASLLFSGPTAGQPEENRPRGEDTVKEQTIDYAVTPTSSTPLISSQIEEALKVPQSTIPESPLVHHLQSNGYYVTPGLRFGSQYSVYPGDPLRFHAHFMANEYGWDEEMSVLDIVGGGRLATAVKKAYLMGGREPDTGQVRTFSIEWASM